LQLRTLSSSARLSLLLVGNHGCNGNALDFRVSSSRTEKIPRGAYAPRSWCSANVCRGKNDLCDARTHIRKSGGRQPAVGMSNAVATVSVHRPPTGRLCATIAVLPLQTRFSNHGWITPAAPGCVCERGCRCAIPTCNGERFPRLAYVRRSWLRGVCSVQLA
jgi:hypothetical protein